ncbi:ABC transporter substrate-binding protein [Caballeronia sp. dw_19]|uniref:ABC transporter substrate-binding protein n=1 Tax=Caballeronia sp. dw_19 TaxID=2719791 RepID=UPI001BD1EB9F|nr:ABC transporter substrate-binding protein [Caballeronia sp. dw_19]
MAKLQRRVFFRMCTNATLVVSLVVGTAGSCAASTAGPDLSGVTITVGQQGAETEGIFIESGAMANAPYQIAYATFSNPDQTLTALSSGRVDIGNNIAQWTATQASAGATPPWTAATVPYTNVLVNAPGDPTKFERFVMAASAQSKVIDIKDSKGKNWGFLPGTSGELFAAKVLDKMGWTFKDVNVVNLDSTNQALALQTGRVDIVFNPRDNLVGALARGAQILGDAYQYDVTIYTGYLANVRSLNDPIKGAAIKDFITRVIRAQDWFVRNPSLAQAALMKYRKLTAEQAKIVWQYTRVKPMAPTPEIAKYSQGLADTALKFGLIGKKVDASALLDPRFSDVIEKTLNDVEFDKHLRASYAVN